MAGPGFYKDITSCTINGNPIEAVAYIRVTENFNKMELHNNGVNDGPVAISQIGRDLTIEISSQDVAFLSITGGDCGVSIVWTGVPVTCGIYTDAASHTYTATLMVFMSDDNNFKQKAAGEWIGRWKQLSGGTVS